MPPPQSRPDGHTVPHAPQLEGSFEVTTQVVPQRVCPGGHGAPHRPRAQTSLAEQVVPQRPQLALLVCAFTSHPLAAVPSQLAKPALQDPTAQAPAMQVEVLLGPAVHVAPHAPQWVALVRVSTSQPLAAMPSQSAKPGTQVNPHRLAVHVGEALGTGGHAVSHAPQWVGSSRSSVSQPFAAFPSQSPKPPEHTLTTHAPARHAGSALSSAGQRMPQAPHSATSVWRLTSQPLVAAPSQSARPVSQWSTAHAPATHAEVAPAAAQARPQVPQLLTLLCVSTQPPVQHVCPVGHARVASQPATHALARHRLPGGQWSSVTHCTQVCVRLSQRSADAPPSVPTARQPSSARQPAKQVRVPGSQ